MDNIQNGLLLIYHLYIVTGMKIKHPPLIRENEIYFSFAVFSDQIEVITDSFYAQSYVSILIPVLALHLLGKTFVTQLPKTPSIVL